MSVSRALVSARFDSFKNAAFVGSVIDVSCG
jgi:hypothetical protein